MYDILELNKKVVSELKNIAKQLNIKKIDTLKKQDLVYQILDQQAITSSLEKNKNKNISPKIENTKPKRIKKLDLLKKNMNI